MAKPFAEAVELAQHVLGQDGADLDGLDVALDERWGVSFATSEEIANELLALTMPFRSPLGGLLQAFVPHCDSLRLATYFLRHSIHTKHRSPCAPRTAL